MSGPGRRDVVDDFLDDLGRTDAPSRLADDVMVRVRAAGAPPRRLIWWPAAAAVLLVALGAGAVWIGTRPPAPSPSTSLEPSPDATPAPTLFVRPYDGISCPAAALPPGPITFRVDPGAPRPDQIVAVDSEGQTHPVFWAAGFTGGTFDDPVVRDPAGEIVARDAEQFRLTPDDDRLHGYRVCSGSDNLYVPLFGREDPDATPGPSAPPATDLGILPGTWVPTAEAPISGRDGHTAVWTGAEMIVWGGNRGPTTLDDDIVFTAGNDGAAYDPLADTWRVLPPAPIAGRYGHSAVWTGTEMIVWGGHDLRNVPRADGAAYDPATDRWRVLASPPFELRGWQAIVWAHDQVVVLDGHIESDSSLYLNVAAYRPATDDWAVLAPLEVPGVEAYSVAYTGSSANAIVVLSTASGSAAYLLNLGSGDWRRLPDPPSLRLDSAGPEVFTGAEVIVPAAVDGVDAIAAFDVATEAWRIATPPLGLGGGGTTWTGTLAFFGLGTRGMDRRTVYDPTRDVWFGVPEAAGIHREAATQVWADDRLLVWGGFEGESFLRPRDGFALVLDARHAIAGREFEEAGAELRVEAFDASGSLSGVRPPSRAEFETIDVNDLHDDGTLMRQLGSRAVLVYWTGGPGDWAARIEIRPDGRTIDLIAVPTYGDAMPFRRAIVLEFDHDVDVDGINLVLWNGRR